MSEKYVIINIGRNINGRPMKERNWTDFQCDVTDAAGDDDTNRLVGMLTGSGWWDGIPEDTASFHVLTSNLPVLRIEMARLAYKWRQEAIAVVVSGPSALIRPWNPQENR